MKTGGELLAHELAAATNTTFHPSEWLAKGVGPTIRSAAHHIGTTRMATEPEDGVVDPYQRNRATGGFILVDEATNTTVGAGMITSGS